MSSLLEKIGLKSRMELPVPGLWMGDSASMMTYLAMRQRYLAEIPTAGLSLRDNGNPAAEALGVTPSRIGLMLLTVAGDSAVLNIRGSLVNAHEWWHAYADGKVTSYEAIRDAVNILLGTPAVKNVTVHVNSTGGHAMGIDSAAASLARLDKSKRAVAHTSIGALSAGYWLASSVRRFTASAMAEVGSIGVMALFPDYTKMLEENGIQVHLIKAGKHKGYGLPVTEFSDEELAYLQGRIDKMYNFFLTHVAKARKLKLADKDDWAEANVYFAGEAKAVGLIDDIASSEDVTGGFSSAGNATGAKAMVISEEKRAAIAAGASPETVLTAEELQVYLEEGEPETDAGDSGLPGEPAAEGEPGADDGAEGEQTEVEDAPKGARDFDPAVYRDLGRAEAKVEQLTAQLATATEKLEAAEATAASLMTVAQAAVTNLQVALSLPKERMATATDLLEQYKGLRQRLEARYPSGRRSDDSVDTKAMDVKPQTSGVPNPYRPE